MMREPMDEARMLAFLRGLPARRDTKRTPAPADRVPTTVDETRGTGRLDDPTMRRRGLRAAWFG